MYLVAVKLARWLFWLALAAGLLSLLLPNLVPLWVAALLAAGCLGSFLYAVMHVRNTRRAGLRCPLCGWVPFAINAWKCKECGQVWDTFTTNGACPRCGHQHDEAACVRCRRISPNQDWQASA